MKCRSKKKSGKAAHILMAFSARERLVLGQRKIDEMSNEITVIPKLLDMIDIAGSIVTIDAMGMQLAIADKIRQKGSRLYSCPQGKADVAPRRHSLFVVE
jgi:hypothetical protein